MSQALERLLTDGENFHVELKETLQGDAPRAIREAVCAFANDLPGAGTQDRAMSRIPTNSPTHRSFHISLVLWYGRRCDG